MADWASAKEKQNVNRLFCLMKTTKCDNLPREKFSTSYSSGSDSVYRLLLQVNSFFTENRVRHRPQEHPTRPQGGYGPPRGIFIVPQGKHQRNDSAVYTFVCVATQLLQCNADKRIHGTGIPLTFPSGIAKVQDSCRRTAWLGLCNVQLFKLYLNRNCQACRKPWIWVSMHGGLK